MNRRTDGTPSDVSVTLKELGLQYPGGYNVEVIIYLIYFFLDYFQQIIMFLGSI